jgi:tRNA-splicing ligase RtcB (3'-phosphate/5'-hydroxy nucleic acid ligase)
MRVPGLIVADDRLIDTIRSRIAPADCPTAPRCSGSSKRRWRCPTSIRDMDSRVGGGGATDARHGVVSPGAIGFDINCGVRLLRSSLRADEIAARMEPLVDALARAIPTGVGSRGSLTLDATRLDDVFARGAVRAVSEGYGAPDDLDRIESEGCLPAAEPSSVSERARERGPASARLGQSLPRSPDRRDRLRRRGGDPARTERGSGHRHDPHRLAWPRPPGVHGPTRVARLKPLAVIKG